ncbi:sensor histidine kinase [Sedimenticola selenatireducens]|uniref:sensor histidine kinase n=1 Tax=Sedimenticola selenatireducens TaxID=191960 RepID=UPI000A06A883|nr:ATP-binding protein [Sedimenticola selenatireducens]
MTKLFRNLKWKPSTVSWLSFVLMGLIVGGVGLSGTTHVINYLEERLTAHSIEHNREIASSLLSKFESTFQSDADDVSNALLHAIEDYKAFGFRIVVLDRKNQTVIVDSETLLTSPRPIKESWLASATKIDGSEVSLTQDFGAAHALGEDLHPMLIWLQEMEIPESGSLVLGIGKDQKSLMDFMGDLHWSLDSVLLLTYLLIALLGYYTMRSIGRIYERRLESRIQERTQELDAAHKEVLNKTKLATIGQTASVLTHEMRNPLASIKLALSSLKGSGHYEDREIRRMDLVLGEVDRLDELLSKTLDYVRPINRSANPVDMDKLFTKVIKQQEPLLEEKGIRIKHESCSSGASLHVDQAQMHQALLNLLKNAIEASPTDGEITSSLRCEDDKLIFEISNAGEAPSAEVQRRAFEPFFTTKPKGTGLGLGLVKRVVEEHGGTVTFSGTTETGTRLTLAFSLREL